MSLRTRFVADCPLSRLVVAALAWMLGIGLSLGAQAAPAGAGNDWRIRPVSGTVRLHGSSTAIPAPSLPFRWDQHFRSAGQAEFVFELPPGRTADEDVLYLPRIGNAFEVVADGRVIARSKADALVRPSTEQLPRLIDLPPGGVQRLVVRVNAVPGAGAGLVEPWLGPRALLGAQHRVAQQWRTMSAMAVTVASGVFGVLAFLVWLGQRQAVYGWYALAEMLWSARSALVGGQLFDQVLLPWPWWGLLIASLWSAAILSIFMFGLALAEKAAPLAHRALGGFAVATAVMLLVGFVGDQHALWRQWRLAFVALGAVCLAVVLVQLWRRRSLELMLLGAVFMVAIAVAVRDWLMVSATRANVFAVPWLNYVWVLFGVSMAGVLAMRLRSATQAQARQQRELHTQLERQRLQLERSFTRQREQDRSMAAMAERVRVIQDIHDGVGHELSHALDAAMRSQAGSAELQDSLRRATDHLKLTVDVLQDGASDIATLLGTLRHRLAPRLESAGITLAWRVDELPPVEGWRREDSRELQLLLYESFTNLLAHASAHRARLSARCAGDALSIELVDDGGGFRLPLGSGNGLASMRARAERLRARLELSNAGDPQYPGACIRLQIPLRRTGANGAAPAEETCSFQPGASHAGLDARA